MISQCTTRWICARPNKSSSMLILQETTTQNSGFFRTIVWLCGAHTCFHQLKSSLFKPEIVFYYLCNQVTLHLRWVFHTGGWKAASTDRGESDLESYIAQSAALTDFLYASPSARSSRWNWSLRFAHEEAEGQLVWNYCSRETAIFQFLLYGQSFSPVCVLWCAFRWELFV